MLETVEDEVKCPWSGCGSTDTYELGQTQDGDTTYRCRSCERGFNENDLKQQHDDFNVVAEMCPEEWVDYGFDDHSEYVHLVADEENSELRCYRSVNDATEPNERIKTTIDDVKFRYYFDDGTREIDYWYLTYMEAMTFMSFVDLMNQSREGRLLFEWSESDGGPMMDNEKTSIEALTLTFTKENGVERHTQIRSEWQSAKSHKMAAVEGDSY